MYIFTYAITTEKHFCEVSIFSGMGQDQANCSKQDQAKKDKIHIFSNYLIHIQLTSSIN